VPGVKPETIMWPRKIAGSRGEGRIVAWHLAYGKIATTITMLVTATATVSSVPIESRDSATSIFDTLRLLCARRRVRRFGL